MDEKINEIIKIAKEEINYCEPNAWGKNGQMRIYLNRSGSKKDAGYVDVTKKEVHYNSNHVSEKTVVKIEKILATL